MTQFTVLIGDRLLTFYRSSRTPLGGRNILVNWSGVIWAGTIILKNVFLNDIYLFNWLLPKEGGWSHTSSGFVAFQPWDVFVFREQSTSSSCQFTTMIGSGEELWVIRNSPFHSFDEMPATQKSSLRLAADSSCRGCAATASQSNYEGIPFILPNFSFCFSHLQSSFINPSKCRNLGRD